jgi:N-acetylglucosamine kinase-like BadF-type ATPase
MLRYAVRSADGRMPKTAIEDIIKKHFKLKNIRDLESTVFGLENHKRDIAQLAHYLTDDLIKSDKAARELAHHAAEQLVHAVTAVAKRTHLTKKAFDLVAVGGIINGKATTIQKAFTAQIKKVCPKAHITYPDCPPEVGAVKMALEHLEEKK